MPVASDGFEPCCNAPAAVAADSLLVVVAGVSQAPNDEQQLSSILDRLAALPPDLGLPDALLADAGCFRDADVEACAHAGIDPLIAPGRDVYHPAMDDRFAPTPPAPADPTPLDARLHRPKTPESRALYARRSHTPEPVFGVIESVLGFRQV